jgi:hypothetical protein
MNVRDQINAIISDQLGINIDQLSGDVHFPRSARYQFNEGPADHFGDREILRYRG